MSFNFGKAASTYDKSATCHKEIANHLAWMIHESFKDSPKNVLDVGAGTGFLTEEFARFFEDVPITLNDISNEMLEVAKSKFQKNNFLQGNAEDIDLSGYDMVISSMSFQWFNNINFFIEKSLRYCKKTAFSIPVLGTFRNWYDILDKLNLEPPIVKHKSKDEILSFCDSIDLSYKKFDEKEYVMNFSSPKDFMRYFKLIGANIPGHQHSIDSLKKLVSMNNHLEVSYQVFFAVLGR